MLDYVVSVRRAIHAHPEIGLANPVTPARILADPADAPGCHAPQMRLDESALPLGAALYAEFAIQIRDAQLDGAAQASRESDS